MTKPLIGITGAGITEMPFNHRLHEHLFSLAEPYVSSVQRAGGIPVIIPPTEGTKGVLVRLDGIIFSGGADIHPQHFAGDADHPSLLPTDAARDAVEIELMKAALKMPNLPILAVCRGIQVLNVALGGTLHVHLPDHVEQDMHRNDEGLWTMHDISVDARSKLAEMMNSTEIHTQSGHHQALDDVVPLLSVVARSSDGVVEAVEHAEHPWCVGVQWHPERTSATDPTQQAIFDKHVSIAGAAHRP